jgi:Tol biopolymer transport system component
MDADGSAQTRLTHSVGFLPPHPTWSPNGRHIAFAMLTSGNAEIFIMNADGSEQTRVTNNSIPDGQPAWSHRD